MLFVLLAILVLLIVIEQNILKGANHFFDGKIESLMEVVNEYLDRRLPNERATTEA